MIIRNLVLKAAQLLGEYDDVYAYVNTGNTVGEEKANLLLTCFNLVESELALNYIPLIKEETVTGKKIYYTTLSSSAVHIKSVKDKNGNKIPYQLFATYLQVEEEGEVCIVYSYTPAEKGINQVSDYQFGAAEAIFAYGIAATYCMSMGLFEEASIWDKKYKEEIESAKGISVCDRLPSRRWV